MNVYASNVVSGLLTFPLLALVTTLPYMIYQYRKFGSIPWLRTLTVYSFIFYVLCAYFMVVLPLPQDFSVITPYAATPQLIPFAFVQEIIQSSTFSLSEPSSWLSALRNPSVYEAFFNVILLVPLGMYLRYYFRRTWWQTLLAGFCMTLFFELSQITGLWGLYEHPYRLFDVDDLILNTLGTMVGYWLVGPALHTLPDMRLVNEEARELGLRASATKRALSFGIDVLLTAAFALLAHVSLQALDPSGASPLSLQRFEFALSFVGMLVFFVVIPSITHGQTLGQKVLNLTIVREDASQASWYQYGARYIPLYVLTVVPLSLISQSVMPHSTQTEASTMATFIVRHQQELLGLWLVVMTLWALCLIVRAGLAAAKKKPFVMLNGVLSNTRVMTCQGVKVERERRATLTVEQIQLLEQLIAQDGTSLDELMERAGTAVAHEVQTWVPDAAEVVVFAGGGNNGGDGWVCARELAEAGYPTTLITSDIAENITSEPARSTALATFTHANKQGLPLRVLVAPTSETIAAALDKAHAVVDAMLGTGFSGKLVREPYAGWIYEANKRRFEGERVRGKGRHRRRTHERSERVRRIRPSLPTKTKDAPFAIAIDSPSGLSAQTGSVGHPTFAADMTLTMLAFKPGLVMRESSSWHGYVKLAKLVDSTPYLAQISPPPSISSH